MTYPTSIDNFQNPSANTKMDDMPHSLQHSQANDAIEALESKVGIDNSADTNSLDYKVATLISDLNTEESNLSTHTGNTSNPHSVTKAQVGLGNVDNNSLSTILQAVYPVGSIYITVTSTNPATVFGFGTWVAFGAGKTLVGFNASETEFDTVEETGGAKTHTLTAAQMPIHNHLTYITGGGSEAHDVAGYGWDGSTARPYVPTSSAGSGQAHNNLQPYIVTYMFKRTA